MDIKWNSPLIVRNLPKECILAREIDISKYRISFDGLPDFVSSLSCISVSILIRVNL